VGLEPPHGLPPRPHANRPAQSDRQCQWQALWLDGGKHRLYSVLDPAHNSVSEVKHPVRDPNTPTSKTAPLEPSPYWGAEPIWDSQTTTHNPMMDEKGRVWFTARVRPPANPDFCK